MALRLSDIQISEKPYESGGKTKPAGAQALMVANLI